MKGTSISPFDKYYDDALFFIIVSAGLFAFLWSKKELNNSIKMVTEEIEKSIEVQVSYECDSGVRDTKGSLVISVSYQQRRPSKNNLQVFKK